MIVGPSFGYVPAEAIPVAGGLMFGKFNQESYLSRLRNGEGLPIQFNRRGSLARPATAPLPDRGPIDIYDIVRADGTTLALFLDMYSPLVYAPPPGFSLVAGPPPDLPRSLVTLMRRGQVERPLNLYCCWRLERERETIGYVRWTGAHRVELKLGPNMSAKIEPDLNNFTASTHLADLEAVLDDYFLRFLPIVSGGVVQGVREP